MHAAWTAKRFDGKARSSSATCRGRASPSSRCPRIWRPSIPRDVAGQGYICSTLRPGERPLYNLTALTLHESAPGHAFQIPIAMEHKDQPMFRQLTYISAYGEGWRCIASSSGWRWGCTTPLRALRHARLPDLARRAPGRRHRHSRPGLDARAGDRILQAIHGAARARDRHRGGSLHRLAGQALSYYLGERAFLDARARAEKALDERFNVRAFHDAVLELGSVPLPVLQTRIDRFIARAVAAYPDLE